MLGLMAVDKKVQDGNLRLVLIKGIGNSFVTDRFDLDKLKHTLNSY
jgi:3-dehydroquinate synthase